MKYEYHCSKCNATVEVIKPINEASRHEYCKCGREMGTYHEVITHSVPCTAKIMCNNLIIKVNHISFLDSPHGVIYTFDTRAPIQYINKIQELFVKKNLFELQIENIVYKNMLVTSFSYGDMYREFDMQLRSVLMIKGN